MDNTSHTMHDPSHGHPQSPLAAWRRVLTLPGRGPTLMQHETVDQRLARLARWALDGRRREAVAALRAWPDAPPLGAQLLAALGQPRAMLDHLGVRSLLRLARRPRRERARRQAMTHLHEARLLAQELACRHNLLPSLVAALRVESQPATVALLRHAVDVLIARRRRRELTAELCLVKAELALLDEDRETARRWAMRVARLEPGNAAAAKLLLRTADGPRQQRAADTLLAEALAAHPDYHDLEALARRRLSELGERPDQSEASVGPGRRRTAAQLLAALHRGGALNFRKAA